MNQNDISFLEYKGFNLTTIFGLESARQWLKNADPDELFWTDPDESRPEYEVNMDLSWGTNNVLCKEFPIATLRKESRT